MLTPQQKEIASLVDQHGITPDAFIDFIAKEDKRTEINHFLWSTCAVGDFIKTLCKDDVVSIDFDYDDVFVVGNKISMTDIACYLCSNYKEDDLFETLNHGFVVDPMGHQDINTYGELHAYIQTLDAQSPNKKSDSALLFANTDHL